MKPKTHRNKAVVASRESGKTLKEVAEEFGITIERVRQIVLRNSCTPAPKPAKKPKDPKRHMRTKSRKKATSGRQERIHNCPCMICHYYGMTQLSPTAEHHWFHDRPVPGRKTPDNETLPLCDGHHQGLRDNSKIALHLLPETWRRKYGRDYDWLKYANELIEEYN